MNNESTQHVRNESDEKIRVFEEKCRKMGLKVTPQRVVIYRELIGSDEHPSAEMLFERVRKTLPSISLDTVNRTLVTLSQKGLAYVLEGSGDARRYDGGLSNHQHFRCIKCKRILDFHHEPFDDIQLPEGILKDCTVLRKTVYIEGICNLCSEE